MYINYCKPNMPMNDEGQAWLGGNDGDLFYGYIHFPNGHHIEQVTDHITPPRAHPNVRLRRDTHSPHTAHTDINQLSFILFTRRHSSSNGTGPNTATLSRVRTCTA